MISLLSFNVIENIPPRKSGKYHSAAKQAARKRKRWCTASIARHGAVAPLLGRLDTTPAPVPVPQLESTPAYLDSSS